MPWIHEAPISIGTPQSRVVYTRPPMRSRASITRTGRPASARLRAAARPATPAPTTRTDLSSAGDDGGRGGAVRCGLTRAAGNRQFAADHAGRCDEKLPTGQRDTPVSVSHRCQRPASGFAPPQQTLWAARCGVVRFGSRLVDCRVRRQLRDTITSIRGCGGPATRALTVRAVDGIPLRAQIFGPPDGYPIVLTHGITCAVRAWAYQIAELAGDYRVIAFDHRGHGFSGVPRRGGFSLKLLAADLNSVLEATPAPHERAVLAGHSIGGIAVAAWSARYRHKVIRRRRCRRTGQ